MFAYAEQYKRSSIAKASRSTQFVSEVMVNEFHVARHCHPIVAQFLQNAIVMNQLFFLTKRVPFVEKTTGFEMKGISGMTQLIQGFSGSR